MSRVLLVEDDAQARESTRKILEHQYHEVIEATDGQEALERLAADQAIELVISDVRMPRMTGLELFKAIHLSGRELPVILMTAFGQVDDAVWAMKLGAADFLMKPFKRQSLLKAVEGALASSRIALSSRMAERSIEEDWIGSSPAMQKLRAQIAQAAPTQATVLLQGESGTGKERAARRIHELSTRKGAALIAINCAALPDALLESELFGHEKGAFTGAVSAKVGLFEVADKGTLLLDEIGDMPLALQAKLLRVLQEGEVRRVGANTARKVDVRVIASTHQNLRALVAEGRFRQDLLFRLEVVTLTLPPLRERPEDLASLASAFLREAAIKHGKRVEGFTPEAWATLKAHAWPGNVRELQNVIERAVIFSTSARVERENLPTHLVPETESSEKSSAWDQGAITVPLGTSLREVEELLIKKTLEMTAGDKNMTAKLLGINSRTVYRKLKE